MSKKFKGKVCVYCGNRVSTTTDHVFAREFFLVKHRDQLPQAPACDVCNGEKSRLEHYLTTVLPLGGRHRDALATVESMALRRLDRNQKLWRTLRVGYMDEKVPLTPGTVEQLFRYIAKGLLWHHWQSILGPDDCVAATVMQDKGMALIGQAVSSLVKRAGHVTRDVGEGTFFYEGVRTVDSPQSSLWHFSIYGGLQFGGGPIAPNGRHSHIFAITGPKSLLPKFWASVFGEKIEAA